MDLEIIFSKKEAVGIQLRDNDPMVITVRHGDREIKRVLIDEVNLADILYNMTP